jgi:hypothetical protein
LKPIRFEVSKFGRTVTLPDHGVVVTRLPVQLAEEDEEGPEPQEEPK